MVCLPRALVGLTVVILVLIAGGPSALGQTPTPLGIPQQGPDIPFATVSVTSVPVLTDELWTWTEGARGAVIDVPADYDRVMVELRIWPEGDPWDRLFMVAVGDVEVLHGTTPRTDMTVRRDITEYRALLPENETALVRLYLGTWVGAMRSTLTLHFSHDDPSAAAFVPADAVVGGMLWVNRGGGTVTRAVTFPDTVPAAATIEFYASGHGGEEFWYLDSVFPRIFDIRVDGRSVMQVVALPYVYALLGFTGSFGETVHGPMWWTAQQGLDIAGIHTGVGEIPPYRATITDPDTLALLSGARTLDVHMALNECCWFTSVGFVLHNKLP